MNLNIYHFIYPEMADSDTATTTDHEISDVDSFASVEMNISALNHLVTELYGQAEELEEHLLTLQKPLEGTQLNQLGQLPFLSASPFRHATFALKPNMHGFGTPGQRYPFHEICTRLRNHLLATDALGEDGNVRLSPELQTLFEVKEPVIGYVALLGRLRSVLQ